MISEIGNIFLSISASISLCLFSLIFFKRYVDINFRYTLGKYLSIFIFFFIFVSFLLLSYAFLADDFSLRYVANNSNVSLENVYKFSAVWGAHEGSILLWVLVLSLWNFFISIYSKTIPKSIVVDMLSIMGILLLFFLLFILFTSNPFDRIFPIPLNGKDLNPLLQDPGLIIHPPMLYIGYVGTSVPFVFAVAILLKGNININWITWLRKWVIATWLFLTFGITLGSWWAYHELGWGGWWFWDPVENASFMPWLAITALLHSLIVSEKRGIFISWSILLSILTFSLSLLGTFLVRSGVLVSVHAFANDPERGLFILLFLSVVIGLSLGLYYVKSPKLVFYKKYSITSKEFMLLMNNLFLTITTFAILLGTLYPLISSSLNIGKISVGAPYFNFIFSALMLPIIFLMSPAIFSSWKNTSYNKIQKKLFKIFFYSVIISYIFANIFFSTKFFIVNIAIFLAVFTVLSSLKRIIDIFNATQQNFFITKVLSVPSYVYANSLAHIGIGFVILGITFSTYFSTQNELVMNFGDKVNIKNISIKFSGVKNIVSKNYISQTGIFDYYEDKNYVLSFFPEKRSYNIQKNVMTEAAISSNLFRDIYIALGDKLSENSWVVRIYYKPFIQLLWYGAALMILGGLFGIFGKYKFLKNFSDEL
ncbi:MAG: heme lyase CcmF/NrfE family subunit [Gammaproteobacteria bacterium]|jgi:cytochrome c-type biogenesis protein CcmF|nr:heme lyase CcmF/NrfE family subunit [Gammaproteobacteria bacterium]MBT7603343.1 heme lyase CcmF/NrfE family subunit [Gammaproteobacteria bacterium]